MIFKSNIFSQWNSIFYKGLVKVGNKERVGHALKKTFVVCVGNFTKRFLENFVKDVCIKSRTVCDQRSGGIKGENMFYLVKIFIEKYFCYRALFYYLKIMKIIGLFVVA